MRSNKTLQPLTQELENFKDSACKLRNKFVRNEESVSIAESRENPQNQDTVERLLGNFIGAAASLALTGLTTLCKLLCEVVKNLWDIIKSVFSKKEEVGMEAPTIQPRSSYSHQHSGGSSRQQEHSGIPYGSRSS